MIHKTYMELVNEAIAEAKVTLDPLTSATFANPPRTTMYYHFKRWVNRAYKSILQKRNEWYFRQERAVTTIYPRLHLTITPDPAAVSPNPAVGHIMKGQKSGVTFKILAIHSTEDVEGDSTIEQTMSVEYTGGTSPNDLILNETLDRVSPFSFSNLGIVRGRGKYSFSELVPYVDEIDETSFMIQPAISATTSPSPTSLHPAPVLTYYPWEIWKSHYEIFSAPAGTPTYLTRTTDGLWDFYPRPDAPFDVSFAYAQDYISIAAYNDTPKLLHPKYDDLIMWMALAEYADFDERPKVYARAKKRIAEFEFLMNRDALPEVMVNLNRFDS